MIWVVPAPQKPLPPDGWHGQGEFPLIWIGSARGFCSDPTGEKTGKMRGRETRAGLCSGRAALGPGKLKFGMESGSQYPGHGLRF